MQNSVIGIVVFFITIVILISLTPTIIGNSNPESQCRAMPGYTPGHEETRTINQTTQSIAERWRTDPALADNNNYWSNLDNQSCTALEGTNTDACRTNDQKYRDVYQHRGTLQTLLDVSCSLGITASCITDIKTDSSFPSDSDGAGPFIDRLAQRSSAWSTYFQEYNATVTITTPVQTTVTVGESYAGWAESCRDANQTSQDSFEVILVIPVIIAAVAILMVIRYL